MKLYSWNVNGYRAVVQKNFYEWLRGSGADVVCLQETKAAPEQLSAVELAPEGYQALWNPCKIKKGYSGVASLYATPPLSHAFGLSDPDYQGEGRCILMEYERFYLFNIYFPNGQKDDARLRYKLTYYDAFLAYAEELRKKKPIVVCGDFNTAHKEIDLSRPKENENASGFLPIERAWLDKFVGRGYVDCFRLFEPGPRQYTWWSFRANARVKNVGWRIDYFFVSEELRSAVKRAWIEPEVMGSDHCPIGLELNI